MAETAIQRLKRLAAEKKAAAAQAESVTSAETPAEEVKDGDSRQDTSVDGSGTNLATVDSMPSHASSAVEGSSEVVNKDNIDIVNVGNDGDASIVCEPDNNVCEPDSTTVLTPSVTLQKASRNHPLVREMEELEAALEQNVPGFVTILRDIHKKLAEDPLTVTLLSLEERGTIVKGMTRHANVTIATKAVKSTSRSKKVTVTASDL